MAIDNFDKVIAGFRQPIPFEKIGATMEQQGRFHSLFYTPGHPGAAAVPTSAIAGDALTSYPGQLTHENPGAGNAHLAKLSAVGTQNGRLFVVDRLWHNASISPTTTTGQTVNSATWPARDRNGTTDGDSVLVGLEVSTATSNGGAITNTTMTYTNSAGTSSRTGTIVPDVPANTNAGTFFPFALASGDVGVRSIQTLTLGTSYGTAVIHLVAYRILAEVPMLTAHVGMLLDLTRLGMPRTYDNTVPFLLWHPAGTAGVTLRGSIQSVHG